MTKIISIANHKGGTGKTSSTINLGGGFSKLGKKVLLIDLDPQRSLTLGLGYRQTTGGTIYKVLKKEVSLQESIIQNGDIYFVPSEFDLSGFEAEVAGRQGREYLLKEALEDQISPFDLVLIDCPPSLGQLTINALTASQLVLVPLQPEFLGLEGLSSFQKILDLVKKYSNPGLQLGGLFATQLDKRLVIHKDVLDIAKEEYPGLVFETTIRRNVSITEAQATGKNIFQYNDKSAGAEDYLQLAKELTNIF